MHTVKATLSVILGTVVAVLAIGFFASIGLAVLGAMVTLGATAALVIGVAAVLNRDDQPQTIDA